MADTEITENTNGNTMCRFAAFQSPQSLITTINLHIYLTIIEKVHRYT